MIYVSDEKDQSPQSWTYYANYFNSIKGGDPTKIVAHAVIGDYPSGCTWSNGSYSRNIEYGAYYYDISSHYLGSTFSICAMDWGQQMQQVAYNSVPQSRFYLSDSNVIESTIIVNVDSTEVFNWQYNSDHNYVEFNQNTIPPEGSVVEVTYGVYEECEE